MSHTVEAETAVVTLAEVLSGARQARMEGRSTHPHTVLEFLHRARPALEDHTMWAALSPQVTDAQERQVLDWFMTSRARRQLVMSVGTEYTILAKIWRRLVTDAVPAISPEQQREHNQVQLMRLNTGRF